MRRVVVLLFFFFSSRRRHTRSDRDWSSDVCSSDLLALGDSAGLDRAKLARCVTSRATAAEVETEAARARRAGARSTPTFYIEGGLIEGAPPIGVFRAVLDSIYQAKTTTAPARPR